MAQSRLMVAVPRGLLAAPPRFGRPLLGLCRFKASLPGKLGDPGMTLMTEPRMHQALLQHMKKDLIFGYGVVGKPIPGLKPDSPEWMVRGWLNLMDKYLLPKLMGPDKFPLPDLTNIESSTEVIEGVDGNKITLYIDRPKGATNLPCLHYSHGGGMAFMSADDPMYRFVRLRLATCGFLVVAPQFRNSGGRLGDHPYPAGLSDCMSSLTWTHANRKRLGISKLVLTGESGGGNLSLASALRAKRESKLDHFEGVFAMCPFIAGPVLWEQQALPSMKECDGYFLDLLQMVPVGKAYDPPGKHHDDPCAWPLAAKHADLEGLPPHVVSVNGLDPLRDEGLAYFEKLKVAGVRAEHRMIEGTPHGGDLLAHTPGAEHLWEETAAAIKRFVDSL